MGLKKGCERVPTCIFVIWPYQDFLDLGQRLSPVCLLRRLCWPNIGGSGGVLDLPPSHSNVRLKMLFTKDAKKREKKIVRRFIHPRSRTEVDWALARGVFFFLTVLRLNCLHRIALAMMIKTRVRTMIQLTQFSGIPKTRNLGQDRPASGTWPILGVSMTWNNMWPRSRTVYFLNRLNIWIVLELQSQ